MLVILVLLELEEPEVMEVRTKEIGVLEVVEVVEAVEKVVVVLALRIQVVEEVMEVKGEQLNEVLLEGQEVMVEILGDSSQEMVILEEVEEQDLMEMLTTTQELPGMWEILEMQIQECQENQE
jgi:hypothetical protein